MADVGREVQSLPCNLNDTERKEGRVPQFWAELVPQIPQIQGAIVDGIASGRYTDEDESRGKENVATKQRKRKTSMQTAGVQQRIRVDPLTEVTQNSVCKGTTRKPEKPPTKAVEVESETDQLPSSETNTPYAGSLLNTENQASPTPDGTVGEIKATRHLVLDENEKKDTHDACCAESEYEAINISRHTEGRRLQNGLDEDEIPNIVNGNASGSKERLEENGTKGTLTHPRINRGGYQDRQSSNEIDGSRGEISASQHASHDVYRLPRPLSSRAPATPKEGHLQARRNVTCCGNRARKGAESEPCPQKYTGHSSQKNGKDTVKLFRDPAIGTLENCEKLRQAEEIDSLSSIPSLASLGARSLDGSSGTSWTRSRELGSPRLPPAENGALQQSDSAMGLGTKKTRKDAESEPCPRKYTGHLQPKNIKDAVKFSSDPVLGTCEHSAKLGHAEEVDSLPSIPSLASLTARSLDSLTSSGESGSAQNGQDREQTTPKQYWNTTQHATLQTPATPYSNYANISPPVQETGPSDLPSNDQVTSSEGSEEYDFRSDPPSGEIQHGQEVVTVHEEGGRERVANRGRANIIPELSMSILFIKPR